MKKKQVFRLKEERQELYKIIENLNIQRRD